MKVEDASIKTLFKKRNHAALPLLSLAVLGACGPTEDIEITSLGALAHGPPAELQPLHQIA